ncbi:MAG: BREX-6 system BrxE protein [Deltaproteobacteria bacterium]
MTATLANSTLDAVLTLQFTVAWAGEGRCDPKRLAWWDTDVIDPNGGGDFFARLLPQTGAWAALEVAREAARRADAEARRALATGDGVRTLFFLGFDVDELLAERLKVLKRAGTAPTKTLPWLIDIEQPFSREQFTTALATPGRRGEPFEVVPTGRQMRGKMPDALDLAMKNLAAALFPLVEKYPMPFFRVDP